MSIGKVQNKNGSNEYVRFGTSNLVLKSESEQIGNCYNISAKMKGINTEAVEITWIDPDNKTKAHETVARWKGTYLVKKEGSFPENENDGEMLENVFIKNKYSKIAFVDKNVVLNKEYYYALFPYTWENIVTNSESNKVSVFLEEVKGWTVKTKGTYYFSDDGTGRWVPNNKGVNSSSATTTWSLTLSSSQEISFSYGVSSERNYDKLTIILDGVTIVSNISGEVSNTVYKKALEAGEHTLQATYSKDSSSQSGSDIGWIIFTNPPSI